MSLLASFTGRAATGPPPGPVAISYGHPLAHGLTGLWVFNGAAVSPNASPVRVVNEVFGNPPNQSGQPHGWSQNSHGPAITFDIGQGFNDICGAGGYLRTAMIPTERITVLMIRRKVDTTIRNFVIWGVSASGASHECKSICYESPGVIQFDFGGFSGDNRVTSGTITPTTEVEILGFVAGARGMAIYRNGALLASKTAAVSRADAGTFNINDFGDIQDVNFFAILNAEWLPSQMLEWMASPYAMLYQNTLARFGLEGAPVVNLFTDLAVMGTNRLVNDGKAFAWDADGNILGELTPPGA